MKKAWALSFCCLMLLGSLAVVQDLKAQSPPPLKAVLIFDMGGRGDGGFNDSAYNGMEKAVAELGVKAVYIEHKRNLDLDHALNEAAASDAEIIIGVGFAFSEKFDHLAARHPDKKFAVVDYSAKYDESGNLIAPPSNLSGLMFKEEEGSFLVGAIAALKSRTGKIGFIGGMDSPIIRKFQAGYEGGAKAVRPAIRIYSQYAGITGQAFRDPQKGYRMTVRMYKKGADVIYHAAGETGAGLFQAARKMNRLAIGVDVDQSAQAPGRVLTSMLKNIDGAVFEVVQACARGNFSGGLKTLGLKEQGVGFVYNDQNRKLIPESIYQQVQALGAKIVSGALTVPDASGHRTLMSRQELRDLLARLQTEIQTTLNKLDNDLLHSAKVLAGKDLRGDFARGILQGLYRANPYIIDCETVSDSGIMVAVEPPAHRSSEGADISGQAHMIKLFKTRKPVLSGSFVSVEGPRSVVIHHPVFSADRGFSGSVSALFAPEYLLSSIIGPIAANIPVSIFLMQTDGLFIYDVDSKQIGLNIFTDPLYQRFPELIKLCRRMADVREGSGVYRFYRKVGEEPMAKTVEWRTVELHGTPWRLAVAFAQDGVKR
ncbi:MAG TPA: BMP family ABC transporter substrate-binding protein [Smithellaceae bacterium]|nr:BMP family ABC transporter substrate-binding protein [Smithellaceae bacterium]HRS82417.1 BMP family ABC transporter substrate-binding protein [Smithellaceae bacterium]HRV44389.1 BMP family ABC transporter substrate-binding protein [Smithellaceae bacterium]